MGNLDVFHPMVIEQLNQKYYFQSLIDQACCCGLLSDIDISKIQTELLMLLNKQTNKWSKGESSSIPVERAQDILASIVFVIGIQLKSYSTPEQAVKAIKGVALDLLFEKGLKIVRRKMASSRHLQKRIADNLFDTPNVYYHSSVIDGINGFFKLYRPQFAAHEIHITADYPTYMGRPELNGIEFIEQYLRYIEAENAFCRIFDSQDIHHLLCGLTRDYCSVPMNLFEPVLLSALGLIMIKCHPGRLDLSNTDIDKLYCLLCSKSIIQIQTCLEKALDTLDKVIELPHISKSYCFLSLPKLAITIHSAVTIGTLDRVFLVPAYPEKEPQIVFSYGERMNDIKYEKLVETIWQADSGEERIDLILQEVGSLADLLDIISDTELCAEDLRLLINMLPLPEFTALLSQFPNDDFLAHESEQLLYDALQNRKKCFSSIEKQQIQQTLNAIQNGNTTYQSLKCNDGI